MGNVFGKPAGRAVAILLVAGTAAFQTGCRLAIRSSATETTQTVPLALSLTGGTLLGTTRQGTLAASGGVGPYTYQVSSGSGNVSASTGLTAQYTAPVSIGANTVTETVQVTDSTGATATTQFTVFTTGGLDSTFASGGLARISIGSGNDFGRKMALQPDGKIIVSGYTHNGTQNVVGLLRLNSDGSVDSGFGSGGVATQAVSTGGFFYGLGLQSTGKIVVAGNIPTGGSMEDVAVVRFNANGTLDNTFGTAGVWTTSLSADSDHGYNLVIQADDKIVVVGDLASGGNRDAVVLRLTANGAPDNTFGTAGVLSFEVGSANDIVKGVAMQADGKIIVSGQYAGTGADSWVARITTAGAIDTTFGTAGFYKNSFNAANDVVETAVVDASGRILLSGAIGAAAHVFRLTSAGALDTTFGTGGSVLLDIGSGNDLSYALKILSNGDILSAGYSNNGSNNDFSAARIKPDGTLETTFGTGGKVMHALSSGSDQAYSALEDASGKILIGGWSIGTNQDFTLIRIWP